MHVSLADFRAVCFSDTVAGVSWKGTSGNSPRLIALSLGVIGLALVVLGWGADHRSAFSLWLTAAEYKRAMDCYEQLLAADASVVFSEGDRGFAEIRPLLQEHMSGSGNLEIVSFASIWTGYSNLVGGGSELTLTLAVTLADGRTDEGSVTGLAAAIEERYLDTTLRRLSAWWLWLGIAVSLGALILQYRASRRIAR